MSLRNLPKINALQKPKGLKWDAPSDVLARWSEGPLAAEADEPNTVSIYDQIGDDGFGGGFGAKRMAAALRSVGNNPVTVNINSPGGDFFDGLAIYNLLVEHPAKVTVRVMGLAASAASIIAMAGDDVEMGAGSFLMVHNAWALAIGNRHDMRAAADVLEPFDGAMAEIYAARTGKKYEDIAKMLDAETWMNATQAIEQGFADIKFTEPATDAGAKVEANTAIIARRQVERALAAQNMTRAERAAIIDQISGPRDATGTAERDAGDPEEDFLEILASIQGARESLTT